MSGSTIFSLKEFSSADNSKTTLKRYNRTAYLKLPKVEFYQLKISYDTLTVEKANPEVSIEKSVDSAQIAGNIIKTTDLSMNVNNISIQVDDAEYGTEYATFNSWIYGIMRKWIWDTFHGRIKCIYRAIKSSI